MLGPIEKALLAVLLLVLMTGIGSTLSGAQFRAIVRRPQGVLIGLASQFGWMPLLAFGLAKGLDLPTPMAIGLVLIGCTPGGTTSNMFTYYAKADVALSVAMTVVSTVVAVVVMPLLLTVYASPLTSQTLPLPLGNIATTLALVLVPIGLGISIRARSPKLAASVQRLGSMSGVVVLVLLVTSSLVRNYGDLAQIPATGYLAAVTLGALGMALGYGASRVLGLRPSQRRAVALETGIQNSPLAFALILATFAGPQQQQILWLPMLYALFVLGSASVATLWFRRHPVQSSNAAPG
ncbi:MAG: bile acid:sodium symporter family protein [Deltaproteobacteria bacterium]|nr:bile acid:sodium symporter family protein [Deltaproteobacteria bacterium]